MRFADRITFVNVADSYYDPIKGESVEGKLIETKKPCKLSRLGVERTNQLFGKMDKEITVARLQHPYTGKVDYVFLNKNKNKKYNVKRQSDYRKGVFYLESASVD